MPLILNLLSVQLIFFRDDKGENFVFHKGSTGVWVGEIIDWARADVHPGASGKLPNPEKLNNPSRTLCIVM